MVCCKSWIIYQEDQKKNVVESAPCRFGISENDLPRHYPHISIFLGIMEAFKSPFIACQALQMDFGSRQKLLYYIHSWNLLGFRARSILEMSGIGSTIHANKPKKWSENLNPQKKYMVDVPGVFFFWSQWLFGKPMFSTRILTTDPRFSRLQLEGWEFSGFGRPCTIDIYRVCQSFLSQKGKIVSSSNHWSFNMFQLLIREGFCGGFHIPKVETEMVPVVELPFPPTCSESTWSQSESCQLLWRQRKPQLRSDRWDTFATRYGRSWYAYIYNVYIYIYCIHIYI